MTGVRITFTATVVVHVDSMTDFYCPEVLALGLPGIKAAELQALKVRGAEVYVHDCDEEGAEYSIEVEELPE